MEHSQNEGIYTGKIERDENGNYFCGKYLLDYKFTEANYKLGDEIVIMSIITNPSDISFNKYPNKSKKFKAKKNHTN